MAITNAQFRIDYPEFSDNVAYPDSAVTYFLNLAYALLNGDRWGAQLDIGAELFVAHNLAIEKRAQLEAANGEVPGTTTGPVASKSVDKVSISFDVGSAVQANAGHWNLTIYGTRFARLIRLFGASPIFVGVGFAPVGSGMAWPGPNVTPGMSNFGN
jgi:hypothetical protein